MVVSTGLGVLRKFSNLSATRPTTGAAPIKQKTKVRTQTPPLLLTLELRWHATLEYLGENLHGKEKIHNGDSLDE
jgi:hypothetical protein